MKFGLENISKLCAGLDHPERAFASIVVAGTNGKGSVTAMVHRGLRAAGHRAARYTSPHLERLEERFVILDSEVETEALRRAIDRVREAIETLQRSGALDAPPTFFECATAVAFDLFREAGVRIAVLEVGLGGRLDATNVVQPVLAAITSIGLDHLPQLGNTLASVAFEKAGVIKPQIPVVVGDLPVEAQQVVEQACRERWAKLIRASDCGDSAALARTTPLALAGRHQQHNAMVAACVLGEIDRLGFPVGAGAIRTALSDVQWPGRLERFSFGGTEFLLDAAHNPDGARALADYLAGSEWRDATLVFAAMQDKAVDAMLPPLAAVCGAVICTAPPLPRAMPAEALAAIARAVPGARWTVKTAVDPDAALTMAAADSARVVVAGSIFLTGPVRGILRARQPRRPA
jgi:dihydrofolate synthase / folylpolyglutamate synthase